MSVTKQPNNIIDSFKPLNDRLAEEFQKGQVEGRLSVIKEMLSALGVDAVFKDLDQRIKKLELHADSFHQNISGWDKSKG